MNEKIIGFFIILITFFHGIFSSGFMPILNKEMGISSSLPFALYFLGILIGQLLIYRFYKLSQNLKLFSSYEILFSMSLISMAIFNNKFGFITGRFVEGIFSGLAIPLLFSIVINLKSVVTETKRLAIFNSISALGFVIGPFVFTAMINYFDYRISLVLFSSLIIFISLIFLKYQLPIQDDNINSHQDISLKKILKSKNSFEKFSTIFLAKSFYGFLITSVPSFLLVYLDTDIDIQTFIFYLCSLFIIGQIIIEKILTKFPKSHLENYLPVLLAVSLLQVIYTKNINYVYLAAIIHSLLVTIGYLKFSYKTSNPREFAFFSFLSDIGMVIGAFLATLGINGTYIIICLMFIPFIRTIFIDEREIRAEKLFPFVGMISMFKIYKKHKNPKLHHDDEILDKLKNDLTFEKYLLDTNNNQVSLLFTGDFCPSLFDYQISESLKEIIYKHDFRLLNLEGVQNTNQSKNSAFHNISEKTFKSIINPDENKYLFNLLSFVNNHVLDQGTKTYNDYFLKIKNADPDNLDIFNSKLVIKDINSIKIGFFAITFGNNIFWRKDKYVIAIKPDDILINPKIKNKIEAIIKNYKSQVDYLIMSYHWGYESEYLPSKTQVDCFEILKGFGIDIIYGHHSHIIQPYEINLSNKNDSLCLYSCGNLTTTDDMLENIYEQGIIYSVNLELINNCVKIKKIEPIFIESKVIDTNLKEIYIIKNHQSLSLNNWKSYT